MEEEEGETREQEERLVLIGLSFSLLVFVSLHLYTSLCPSLPPLSPSLSLPLSLCASLQPLALSLSPVPRLPRLGLPIF